MRNGNLDQVFGAGTAHVVTSVGASQQDMLSIHPSRAESARLRIGLCFGGPFPKAPLDSISGPCGGEACTTVLVTC